MIDWHNYGYSLLSMNLKSSNNPIVSFAKWFVSQNFSGLCFLLQFYVNCMTTVAEELNGK